MTQATVPQAATLLMVKFTVIVEGLHRPPEGASAILHPETKS